MNVDPSRINCKIVDNGQILKVTLEELRNRVKAGQKALKVYAQPIPFKGFIWVKATDFVANESKYVLPQE